MTQQRAATSPETFEVFVYGTLLRGEPNHRLLAHAEFIAEASTCAEFALHDHGPFPAMTLGTQQIHGELYRVDADTLAALDRLEGHPRFYHRTHIHLSNDRRVETYLMRRHQVADLPLIEGGSWRHRHQNTPSHSRRTP